MYYWKQGVSNGESWTNINRCRKKQIHAQSALYRNTPLLVGRYSLIVYPSISMIITNQVERVKRSNFISRNILKRHPTILESIVLLSLALISKDGTFSHSQAPVRISRKKNINPIRHLIYYGATQFHVSFFFLTW